MYIDFYLLTIIKIFYI